MSKKDILKNLKVAVIELNYGEANRLLEEGLEVGLSPMEMITEGLNPGLTVIGDGFARSERFISDLMLAGDIMSIAMETLLPQMETSGQPLGDTMVIGTVEGDLHTIGKRVVYAVFTGAGYTVVDIGENISAEEFVKAVKEHKATIVGASAIIGPVQPYCKVINDALVDAGIRDDVVYCIGGFRITQDLCDNVGADCYGEDAFDGLDKVKIILAEKKKARK